MLSFVQYSWAYGWHKENQDNSGANYGFQSRNSVRSGGEYVNIRIEVKLVGGFHTSACQSPEPVMIDGAGEAGEASDI